jgi:hypothetical protein
VTTKEPFSHTSCPLCSTWTRNRLPKFTDKNYKARVKYKFINKIFRTFFAQEPKTLCTSKFWGMYICLQFWDEYLWEMQR